MGYRGVRSLTAEQVREIRAKYNLNRMTPKYMWEVGKLYGVKGYTIQRVLQGTLYKDVS